MNKLLFLALALVLLTGCTASIGTSQPTTTKTTYTTPAVTKTTYIDPNTGIATTDTEAVEENTTVTKTSY